MKSHTSIHWSRLKKTRYLTQDIEKLKNFRNNQLSKGLDDFINEDYGNKLFKDLSENLTENYILNFFNNKNIGNSKSILKYKNNIIHYSHLFFIKWINILEEKIKFSKEIKLICEIGGGYGGLIEKILNKYSTKVILIDLELTNQLSYYYLKNNFPDKKIKYFKYDDIKRLSLSDLEKIDIAILTPDIEIDPNVKINLFINSRSFAEMEYSTIKAYFSFINSNIAHGGFFLNINRYVKKSVGHNIYFYRYPYGKNWETIYSDSSWQQDKVHFLLTKKIYSKKNFFKKTLNEIKTITSIKKRAAFKEFLQKLPKNPIKKSILISSEISFIIIEAIFPYALYVYLSKIKYLIMTKKN